MALGDVSHEEGGGSKSVSPSELGFLQAERSESQQRCSSDLRAAPEHFRSRLKQIPQKLYIYVLEDIPCKIQVMSKTNKGFFYLQYMRPAKVSTKHIITSKARNY